MAIFVAPLSAAYVLSLFLHDALPISFSLPSSEWDRVVPARYGRQAICKRFMKPLPKRQRLHEPDRKSTRLNSSHEWISYAVFCLKKKLCYHLQQKGMRKKRHPPDKVS